MTVGEQLDFSHQFTDSSDVAADPTTVLFRLVEGIDGTELLWRYTPDADEGIDYPTGGSAMVKAATGLYTVAWVARKPERHTGNWQGSGTVYETAEETRFVRHSGVPSVEG